MRIKNSIINVSAGLGSQLIITLLSFISRTVFINSLGVEFLGINGLFSNILGMLALAEAGIGSSIIYALYKPVAENNIEKINALMRLYRNAYRIIALIVFILGVSLLPFLKYIVGDTTIENVNLIYCIFLLSTVSSYFYSYKVSLLNVNQKNYIATGIYSLSSIISTCIKIAIIYYTKDYVLYLIIDIALTLTTSIILSIIVDRIYPYLKNKVIIKLDIETKTGIIKNMKAMVLHQIGGYAVFGTDNIIISSFISVVAVGLYSNYYMLINICRTFINQIFDNITHSIGNLVAEENETRVYSVFKVIMLFNFWIYSFFTIVLYITISPFISLWIGNNFLLSDGILIIIMLNFFVSGMRRSISMVKQTSGIFHEDRYAPFVEAAVNLVVSIILVQYWGIAGVFFGTFVSTIAVPFWIAPYLVYKKSFKVPLRNYFAKYAYYFVVGLATLIITYYICGLIISVSLISFAIKTAIALIIPNIIYVILFRKTEEFIYLFRIVKSLFEKLSFKNRKGSNLTG
ncbi:lipopolysaccharide biosynthesis protein [Paenibacillus sp. 1_12]|uniref:lipopolysaccharide biosynthesis protein n=1 Tax=Paenibacillus sp. 1_12 TaxID=1566278 RepID=UPI000B85AA3A|nr:oligosaccharide flippase family protein [Paenibacillus sp. 1_12]